MPNVLFGHIFPVKSAEFQFGIHIPIRLSPKNHTKIKIQVLKIIHFLSIVKIHL